jgi:hypothetical protein
LRGQRQIRASVAALNAACPGELPTQAIRTSLSSWSLIRWHHAPRKRDIAALIGVVAVLEGEVSGTQDAHEIPGWAAHLAQRLSRDGLFPLNANRRELRQALNNLNHRLRYMLGEYDEPPDAMPVP